MTFWQHIYVDFIETFAVFLNDMYREGINQFIRKGYGGCFNCSLHAQNILSRAYVLGPVIERGVKLGGCFLCPCSHILGQVSPTCALFQHDEMRGALQFLPHGVELPSHTVCEQAGDIRAGEIVALPTYF